MPESVFSSGWNYQGRCGRWGFQEAQVNPAELSEDGKAEALKALEQAAIKIKGGAD